jgi:lipopolysaccharide export LptBFGC system permease protein LptF
MQRTCRKCNHVNAEATGAATEACPNCGAIYAQVEALEARRRASLKAARVRQAERETPERTWYTPKLAKAIYVFVLAVYAIALGIAAAAGGLTFAMVVIFFVVAFLLWILLEVAIVIFVISEDLAAARQHLAALRARAEADDA